MASMFQNFNKFIKVWLKFVFNLEVSIMFNHTCSTCSFVRGYIYLFSMEEVVDCIFIISGAYGSWSKLGSAAESVPLDEPTVVLNFDHCKDDFDIEATILHQFGHVLGLGHMHQDSKYWEVITKFLHMDLMLENLNISRKQFDTQWSSSDWIGHQWIRMGSFDDSFTQKCNYDEDSIMHYQ